MNTIKGYARLKEIAEELSLPLWWVESVVVEYLPCREYLKKGNFWLFNFNRLNNADANTIRGTKVVFNDTLLFQNVRPEVVADRMLTAVFGVMPVVPLDMGSNILPNGIVNESYFPYQMNPIDVWDQKLSFSEYAKIFDEGRFYQLRIAQFGPFHPTTQHRGWFKSGFLDLEPLRIINDEIYDLRNKYCSRDSPVFKDRNALKILRKQVAEKYVQLEEIKAPLRKKTLGWFQEKKNELMREEIKVQSASLPPILTHFDSLKISDGKYKICFHIEPLLYRAAMKNLAQAKKEAEKRRTKSARLSLSVLEEIEASALCITSAVTCAEAYINFIIKDVAPSVWTTLERTSLDGKWLLLSKLLGSQDCFEKGKGVYNKFSDIVQWRNNIVHYKFGFEKTGKLDDGTYVSMAYSICNAKNAEQATKTVAAMIKRLSEKTSIPCPPWLQANGLWLKDL